MLFAELRKFHEKSKNFKRMAGEGGKGVVKKLYKKMYIVFSFYSSKRIRNRMTTFKNKKFCGNGGG